MVTNKNTAASKPITKTPTNLKPVPGPGKDDLLAELAKLKAENEALKARAPAPGKITLKVQETKNVKNEAGEVIGTEKGSGAVSMYGLGRFPTTLFVEQWERVIDEVKSGRLEAFLKENAAKLSRKVR